MLSIGDLDFNCLVVLLQNSWVICNEFLVLIFFFCNLSSMIHHFIQLKFIHTITFDDEQIENKHIHMKIYFSIICQSFKLMTLISRIHIALSKLHKIKKVQKQLN